MNFAIGSIDAWNALSQAQRDSFTDGRINWADLPTTGVIENNQYTLISNIDLTGVAYTPVTTMRNCVLDGNNFIIHNLTINQPSLDYQALI